MCNVCHPETHVKTYFFVCLLAFLITFFPVMTGKSPYLCSHSAFIRFCVICIIGRLNETQNWHTEKLRSLCLTEFYENLEFSYHLVRLLEDQWSPVLTHEKIHKFLSGKRRILGKIIIQQFVFIVEGKIQELQLIFYVINNASLCFLFVWILF